MGWLAKLLGKDKPPEQPYFEIGLRDTEPTAPPGASRPAAGTAWEGPATWTTDPTLGGRPGYYGLMEDGRTLHDPPVLLTYIDDAPDDPTDGAGHYEVADVEQPYYPVTPPHMRSTEVVLLEAETKGASEVSVDEQ